MEKPVAWVVLHLKENSCEGEENFGLELSNVWVEKYPLIVVPFSRQKLQRKDWVASLKGKARIQKSYDNFFWKLS